CHHVATAVLLDHPHRPGAGMCLHVPAPLHQRRAFPLVQGPADRLQGGGVTHVRDRVPGSMGGFYPRWPTWRLHVDSLAAFRARAPRPMAGCYPRRPTGRPHFVRLPAFPALAVSPAVVGRARPQRTGRRPRAAPPPCPTGAPDMATDPHALTYLALGDSYTIG